jgi:hypothetical protein
MIGFHDVGDMHEDDAWPLRDAISAAASIPEPFGYVVMAFAVNGAEATQPIILTNGAPRMAAAALAYAVHSLTMADLTAPEPEPERRRGFGFGRTARRDRMKEER